MIKGRTTAYGASSLKLLLFLALAANCFGQMQLWKYVPPEPAALVVMEWRRVLDSPNREAFRREVPAAALQLLGGVNFIEGIERAVVSGTGDSALILLGGNFDSAAMREAAVADGGIVKMYREAQILQPADPEQAETVIGLVGKNVVMIGKKDTVLATLDASQLVKLQPRGMGYDLWVYNTWPSQDVMASEFGLAHLKDGNIRIDSTLRLKTPAAAAKAVKNAAGMDLTATQMGNDVKATGTLTPDLLSRRLGEWRASLDQVVVMTERKQEPVPTGPQKVKIYGLDGGPKEVTFPATAPPER